MLKKFLIFVLVIIGIFYWADNFVKTGKLQDYIDKNSDKPWAPKVQFYLGSIYQTASDYENAEFCFNRILEKYPESEYGFKSMYQIGDIYAETRRRQQAIEIFKKIMVKYPQHEKIPVIENRISILSNI